MGSRLSGGIASLRYVDYAEWLPVFRRLSDRELWLGECFSLPGKSANAGGFYNANTAYNPPQSFSIIWPQPVLTIRMLKDPIPGVTLDAEIIRNRGMTEIRR